MRLRINLLLAPIIALLFAGAVQGLHEPLQSKWRTYSSRNAQVQFEVPADWNVYERDVCVGLTPPTTVLLLKIAPKEISEEALLARPAPIEIHVDYLSEPMTLDEWADDSYLQLPISGLSL